MTKVTFEMSLNKSSTNNIQIQQSKVLSWFVLLVYDYW